VSGQPILKGTRVIADSIYPNYEFGIPVEEIADMYSVPVEQVQKSIDYVLARVAVGEAISRA
jgi:uncharacterized protein (DUF433 family)